VGNRSSVLGFVAAVAMVDDLPYDLIDCILYGPVLQPLRVSLAILLQQDLWKGWQTFQAER
jgi:hypothetical protein